MSRKYSLLIGCNEYQDAKLARLKMPATDVQVLADVLRDPSIGEFNEIIPLVNQPFDKAQMAIADLFADKSKDDLILLYFSGHGVLDDQGRLYLAMKNTRCDRLSGSAIPASFITDEMDNSRSKRQVLILDCCQSGAYARGSKGAIGQKALTQTTFEGHGYGRVVLTATDATQYAWEGDKIIGDAENSLFTHFLVYGLKTGAADIDGDGLITIEEWYDYCFDQITKSTSKQKPLKWNYKQAGKIVIAQNPYWRPSPIHKLKLTKISPLGELEEVLIETHDQLVTLGRSPKSNVHFNDSRVSWEHGEIILENGRFYYRHLSGTNPTSIIQNNKSILLKPPSKGEVLLTQGDFLVIGKVKILVEFDLPPADPDYIVTDPRPEEIE